MSQVVAAPPVIGVLGGGQLGWMLGRAGNPLGARFRFWDPSYLATARHAGELFAQPFDAARAEAFATGLALATFEFESVPIEVARAVEALVPVFPPPRSLEVAQDRLLEKRLFASLGIPVNRFAPVDDPASLEAALAEVGLPAVLKTRRGGYDGKGQRVARTADEARRGREELGGGLLLEAFVPFARECSALVVRGRSGERAHWPLVENEHRRGILHRSRFLRGPDDGLLAAARAHAGAIADALGHVGVLALELFVLGDGSLVANEIAPRVHNSGHLTIEGSATSQFENHVRALLGWPLGDTASTLPCEMVNLVGELPDLQALFAIPGARVHLYDKTPAPGRKLGHVTLVRPDDERLAASVSALLALLPREAP